VQLHYCRHWAGIAITENEGNGRLSCAWPKTHIVIVGLEKVLPSMADLALFWPLLATFVPVKK
jgi:L-lactate dehydrogenase complex protein LldF